MRKTRSLTPVVTAASTFAAAVIFSLTAGASATFAKGPNDPATECLIGLFSPPTTGSADAAFPATVTCKDGDACDNDGATNGSCTFKLKACVNIAGVSGCTPQAIKGKAKVVPKKYGISVTPNGTSQACGASFSDVVLKLKGKPGKFKKSKKARLTAIAKGTEKRAKDVDKSKVQCIPCDKESCVPPTTTTTTITVVTTTTTPPVVCGDGVVSPGEDCDNAASVSGCFASEECDANCKCQGTCGNGIIGQGEICDPGAAVSGCSDNEFCDAVTCNACIKVGCGDGTIGAGEICDPGATPNGCNTNEFCDSKTCASCSGTCSQLGFQLGLPTEDCGFPGQNSAGLPPFSGELRDQNGTKITAGDLGEGCLYIGGGIASTVPPGPTPDGSETRLGVVDCSGNTLTLRGADTGNKTTCSAGPKQTTHCANGIPGSDGQGACASDDDCQQACSNGTCRDGAPGTDGNGACTQDSNCGPSFTTGPAKVVCQPDPSCYFGSPLPIANGGLSTCVLNVVKHGVSGTADKAAGSADVTLPLKSWVYLTGLEDDFNPDVGGHPCPVCEGTPAVCSAGPNKGQPCSTNSSLGVTHDCPPPAHLFLAPLDVTLGPLSTDDASATAPDLGTCGTSDCQNNLPSCCSGNKAAFCATDADCQGIFCQGPPAQPNGGAFGRTEVRTIFQGGSAAAGGLDGTCKDARLASVFCIPPTNSPLIDGSANLPGPGSTALDGCVLLR